MEVWLSIDILNLSKDVSKRSSGYLWTYRAFQKMCRREVVVVVVLVITFFEEVFSFYAPFIKINFENSSTNVGFAWSQNCIAGNWEGVDWDSTLCLTLLSLVLSLEEWGSAW